MVTSSRPSRRGPGGRRVEGGAWRVVSRDGPRLKQQVPGQSPSQLPSRWTPLSMTSGSRTLVRGQEFGGLLLEPWPTRRWAHAGSGEKGARGHPRVDGPPGTHTPLGPQMHSLPLRAERIHSWPSQAPSRMAPRTAATGWCSGRGALAEPGGHAEKRPHAPGAAGPGGPIPRAVGRGPLSSTAWMGKSRRRRGCEPPTPRA